MSSVVLVTGGSGLVGKAIEHVWEEVGPKDVKLVLASSKDADLRNEQETLQLFDKVQPTFLIHLAASVGGLYKNMTSGADMLIDNLQMTVSVVKAARQHNVMRAIWCLSTCVFPRDKLTFSEEDLHSGPPHASNEGYAHAKRIIDVACRCVNEQDGFSWQCVIPTNIYGPHDNFDLEYGHVIPSLIHRAYLAAHHGTPLLVRGQGMAKRQFIFSHDLAYSILKLLFHPCEPIVPVIVAPTEEVSISHVVGLLVEMYGIEEVIFDTSYSEGQPRKYACNNRMLGFGLGGDITPLREGLKKTVRWFNEHYASARGVDVVDQDNEAGKGCH